MTFSTLQAGRVAATHRRLSRQPGCAFAFSTLQAGRVAATLHLGSEAMIALKLSVPSKRVESLQLLIACHERVMLISFSTLQAGRVAATCANRASALPPLQLSVPSKRVESLQRFVVYERSVDDGAFQYPPSGSSRCNRESVLQQHKKR